MKKMFFIILIVSTLLSGNILPVVSAPGEKTSAREKLLETRRYMVEVRDNNIKLSQMKLQAITKNKKTLAKIRVLMNNKDKMTIDQIETLKISLAIIKDNKQKITEAESRMKNIIKELRKAKSNTNFVKAKQSFEVIVDTQKVQKDCLKNVIAEFDKILSGF